MQAKLLVEREVLEFHPGTTKPHAPPGLVAQCERRGKRLFAPAGTLIDDPMCYMIVLNGQAEPADDECRAITEEAMQNSVAMQQAARRLAAGIRPEDFEKFDNGEILGYTADGKYVPGPNANPATQSDEDSE